MPLRLSTGRFTGNAGGSWGSRVGGSFAAAGLGIILLLGAAAGLFWNEGRAVQTARSLAEAGSIVVTIGTDRIDPANDGRLVHLTGRVETAGDLRDPEFGVSAPALRLVRTAEMYQWEEDRHEDRDGATTYSYSRTWSASPIDSSLFYRSGHDNPAMRWRGYEAVDELAALGAFRPGAAVLRQLDPTETLPMGAPLAEAASGQLGVPVLVSDGRFYIGQDPERPQIGDHRISYGIVPAGPVSIIGRQSGEGFLPYQTTAGDALLLVQPGIVAAAEMVRSAEIENMVLTWFLRLIGAGAMALGFFLIMRPVAVAVDFVPVLGTILRGGIGLAAMALTAVIAPAIIAIAWLWYRPLVSVLVLALGLAGAYGFKLLAGRRAAALAPVQPGGEPTAAAGA